MSKYLISRLWLGLAVVALTSAATRAASFDIRIALGNDDVEEFTDTHDVYLDSSDLEMPYEDSVGVGEEQVIGLRFVVPVPRGVKILKAYVQFRCDETKNGTDPVNLVIQGQLAADAPAFADVAGDVTGRTPTQAQVPWAVPDWTTVGQVSQTPDLAAILQEIVDQPGWSTGNALVLIFSDDKSNPSKGIRCADAAEEGASGAPLLHLEIFNPAANTPKPANGTVGVFMPLLTWTKGDGAVSHTVYLGPTADLTQADLVAANLPMAQYYHAAGLQPGVQYYWRVNETDMTGKVTAGPVWSFVMQAETAYHPAPADGSVDASPATALTWQPGLGAIKHHVYFGDSLDAVTQGTAQTDQGETLEATFTPPALDTVTTYYWRVDEFGVGNALKAGSVWSFTTCLPVDDFESYTDDLGSTIFDTWLDGYATGLTGSTVGNTNAPFAEQMIVHGGLQSMPMDYNNINAPFYSEAELDLGSAQNWTAGGVADLRLDFRGNGSNGAGSLYVALEDSSGKSAVVTHPDPAAVTKTTWTEWKIPLSSFAGVNLAKIKVLYLGVGDRMAPVAGGAGRIYIDDIRLTRP